MKISGRNGSKKKLGGTNMLNYSNELKKLSEGSGSRSLGKSLGHVLERRSQEKIAKKAVKALRKDKKRRSHE